MSLPWEKNLVAMKVVLWAWRWVDHLVTKSVSPRVAMSDQPKEHSKVGPMADLKEQQMAETMEHLLALMLAE